MTKKGLVAIMGGSILASIGWGTIIYNTVQYDNSPEVSSANYIDQSLNYLQSAENNFRFRIVDINTVNGLTSYQSVHPKGRVAIEYINKAIQNMNEAVSAIDGSSTAKIINEEKEELLNLVHNFVPASSEDTSENIYPSELYTAGQTINHLEVAKNYVLKSAPSTISTAPLGFVTVGMLTLLGGIFYDTASPQKKENEMFLKDLHCN